MFNITIVTTLKNDKDVVYTSSSHKDVGKALDYYIDLEGYELEREVYLGETIFTLYKDYRDDYTTPVLRREAIFKQSVIGNVMTANIEEYMLTKGTRDLAKASSAIGISYDELMYAHNDVTGLDVDLSNPMWNTAAGGHTWDMVSSIANGNNTYDKDDTIFLTYMMKHIVRAGIKPYENKTTLQSKIIDLDKARTYMNAWIDKLENL